MTDLPARVRVTSLAKPVPETLLAARTAVRVSPDLQAVFKQAKAEGWSSERLADALFTRLPDYVLAQTDLWQTALYLADEYLQLGDHLLLVSPETGKVVAKLTEEDIYLPAPVSRETEDGKTHLAQPLPRLRPDLEGMLVEWHFTKGRENRLVTALAKRANQTELFKQEGDPRLLRATKGGRKQIVDRLREALPTFLQAATGVSGELLNLFTSCAGPLAGLVGSAPCTGFARALTPVVDPLTFNLHHDPYTTLQGQITSQWTRDIARVLAGLTYAHGPVNDASVLDSLPNGLWIAEPDVAMALRGKLVFPVERVPTVLLHTWNQCPVAKIWVRPDSYQCQSREFLDRWEVAASFEFVVYLDPRQISAYDLKDVPESGVHTEVVA
jgi:hypothetical protein